MLRAFLAILTLFAAWPAAGQMPGETPLTGRVVSATTQAPIEGATVEAGRRTATTDESGRFSLALPRGSWSVEIKAPRHLAMSVKVEIGAAPPAPLEVVLRSAPRFTEDVVVSAPAQVPLETPATIPVRPAEVLTVAGGGENVFRVLQTLPGVTGTDEFGSRMSVRGGGPDQNLTVMDGVEIHNPYRLFGLTSAFNPETVDSFELTAGAFSARYGDRLSSLLVVETRPGSRERDVTGSSAVSLTDTNLILEGRVPGDSGSWLLTGRRTYYDLVAERFTDEDLPSFNDVQGKAVLDVAPGKTLTFFGLGSRERTDAAFDSPSEGAEGAVLTKTRNDLFTSSFAGVWGNRATTRTVAAFYKNDDSIDFGGSFRNETKRSNAPGDAAYSQANIDVVFESRVRDFSVRQEASLRASDTHLLNAGFETHALRTRVAFDIEGDRNPTAANGSSLEGGAGLPSVLESVRTDTRSGAWIEDSVRISRRLTVDAGLRFDHTTINDRTEASPRLTANLALGRKTRLRLATGFHTQSPGYEKLVQADYFVDLTSKGPIALDNERARHALVSLERDLAPGVLARVEAYVKDFSDLLAGRLETPAETAERVARYDFPAEWQGSIPSRPIITSYPTNDGRGRAYGFDVYLARRATSSDTRLTGWASYTFGKAEREGYGLTYPFDYDRRHAFSLVGSYKIRPRLELALTARAASGFPTTPVVGLRIAGIEDLTDTDGDGNRTEIVPDRDAEGRPVWEIDLGGLDNLNSGHMPYFARLDARLTYKPTWGHSRWQFYIDVLNVLNRKNAGFIETSLEYDPDGDRPSIKETPTGSIPFIPSFGIHVRF